MPDEQIENTDRSSITAGTRINPMRLRSMRATDISGAARAAPRLRGRSPMAVALARRIVAPNVSDTNPLDELPFPNPGDRIRADDFKKISQSLLLVRNAFRLSATVFGQPFDQAKLALEAQQYRIVNVITVFGTEIENLDDPSLENRKAIQVMPADLGEPEIVIVVTESVETRRFTPNLIGLNQQDASDRLRNILGDISFPGRPMEMPDLENLTVAEARNLLQGIR